MRNLLFLLPLLAGCGLLAESAPVVREGTPPAEVAPGTVEVSAPAAVHVDCDCGPNKAKVATALADLDDRVAALEKPKAEPKLTQPAPVSKPAAPQDAQGLTDEAGGTRLRGRVLLRGRVFGRVFSRCGPFGCR